MKKIFSLCTILVLIFILSGCGLQNNQPAQKQNDKGIANIGQKENSNRNNAMEEFERLQNKSKAVSDIQNASIIASALARSFANGTLQVYEEDQELRPDKGYGKIMVDDKSLESIPVCIMNNNFKFFVSVSDVADITIKVGEKPETAVQLIPKPNSYASPYDILN